MKREPILAAAQHPAEGGAGIDRRNLRRWPVRFEATFEVGETSLPGELHNLNAEGAYLGSEVILPPFATIKRLQFRLSGSIGVEVAEAMVVWNNDGRSNSIYPRGMGLFFVSINPDQTRRIKRYLSQQPAE